MPIPRSAFVFATVGVVGSIAQACTAFHGAPAPPVSTATDAGVDGAAPIDAGLPSSKPTAVGRRGAFASYSTAPTLDVDRPAETLAGDVIFAMLYSDLTAPYGMPDATWNLIDGATLPCTNPARVDWAYHVATAQDPTSFSFIVPGSNFPSSRVGILISYRGVAVTGPSGTQTASGPAGPFTVPPIKTTADGSILIAAFALRNPPTTWTAPPGMDTQKAIDRLAVFDKLQPTAGDTDPETAPGRDDCFAGAAMSFGPLGH
jgi:hypothetical protein